MWRFVLSFTSLELLRYNRLNLLLCHTRSDAPIRRLHLCACTILSRFYHSIMHFNCSAHASLEYAVEL